MTEATNEAGLEQESDPGAAVLIRDTTTGRFIPGHSGNPDGRPKKGHTIADRFQRLGPATNSRIAATMVKQAIAGNDKQQRLIMEYQSGLPQRNDTMQISATEPLFELLAGIRQALAGPVIEGEYTVTDEDDAKAAE